MRISKKRFKAVLCAILSMCIFAYSAYPVFAEEQAAQEASTEQTQATTIDPNDIDALENRRQELQAQSDKYQQILEKTKENIADRSKTSSRIARAIWYALSFKEISSLGKDQFNIVTGPVSIPLTGFSVRL